MSTPAVPATLLAPVPELEELGVVAGITRRSATGGGPEWGFGLTGAAPTPETAARWRSLQAALGFPGMVTSRQVHGTRVEAHRAVDGWRLLDGLDGHVTRAPGLLLTITVADCIPVYLVDPVSRSVGLLHAGWRGVAGGILEAGLQKLHEVCGARAADVVMHAGTGICAGCYEVGPEVLRQFGNDVATAPGPLDLRGYLTGQASQFGLRNVSMAPTCTAHETQWFSHRASGGRDGRMVAYLGLPI